MKSLNVALVLVLLCFAFFLVSSCTENQRARQMGGTATVNLEQGQRVVTATWRNNDLWILTTKNSNPPKNYELIESSSMGILNGKVIIIER